MTQSLNLPIDMVGLVRIELTTSPLSGVRSSQLSYRPGCPKLPLPNWWSWSGSNRRPPACKAGALPTELQPLRAPMNSVHLAACSFARCRLCNRRPGLTAYLHDNRMLRASKLVGLDGFEPSTPALSRRCSNQLSYRPDVSGRSSTAMIDQY